MSIVERLPRDASSRQVLRAVRSKMNERLRRSPKAREARKAAYQLALEHHDYWRKLTTK